MEHSVSDYQFNLAMDDTAMEYLNRRGITEETASTHRLGVVGKGNPLHESHEGWLAIPYIAGADAHPVTVRFRCMEDHDHKAFHGGKYATISGDHGRMYNVPAIHRADDAIHICEGELDAIILAQCGYDAVALPGANSWKWHHQKMLAGFSRAYVWADPDAAGRELAGKILSGLRGAAIVVRLDAGDVGETYLAGGSDAIVSALERAKDASEAG